MNYYKILEIEENATQDQIKKSFRKLSLKFHPDKPSGDIEKFKKINEAYQNLGDPEKRKEYDFKRKGGFPRGMPFQGGNGEGNPMDIFNMFFNQENDMGGFGGFPGHIFMNGNMGGQGQIFVNGRPVNIGRQNSFQHLRKPTPIIKSITITLEQAYTGVKYPLTLERWVKIDNEKRIEKEKIYVDIPKGIDDNELIIMRDKGNIMNETLKGDLKIFVRVNNTSKFKREGLNLIYDQSVSLKESLIGFKLKIKHLNGRVYDIENETQKSIVKPGTSTVIANMGMMRKESIGNLIIKFSIIFPDKLTDDQIDVIKKTL
mgnify:CR=1 FL=1